MRTRPRIVAGVGRLDLVGVLSLALLLAAALTPGSPDLLLALANVAAVAWIACDGVRDDRAGPRARLVMALALALLGALPAVVFAADPQLWAGAVKPKLDGGMALWSIGVLSIAAGARLGYALPVRTPEWLRSALGDGPGRAVVWRGRRGEIGLAVIVVVCLGIFIHEVGGPVAYLKNLDKTGATASGLTYYIWGISFAKYASFLVLGETWRARRRPTWAMIAGTAVTFVLLLFLGSRLLLLVGMIQLLLLYAALVVPGRRFVALLGGAAVVGAILFVVLGEYRRWEARPHHPSFPSYFFNDGLRELDGTYVNQYADAIRLSVIAREVVPRHADYEYGKELLRVILHPIPSTLRPTVSQAPALKAAYTSGKNTNALPVPVEGYIEFGFPGVVIFSLLLGAFVGLVDRIGAVRRDIGLLGASIACATGAVIVLRGSLPPGVAVATIDVLGFFLAHRLIYRRAR